MKLKGKIPEMLYLGMTAVLGLLGVHEFARYGWTAQAGMYFFAFVFGVGFVSLMRHTRRTAEFQRRYPGWLSIDAGQRRSSVGLRVGETIGRLLWRARGGR